MNIANFLYQAANHSPKQPAIYIGSHPWCNYEQLAQMAALQAKEMQAAGLKQNDKVMICMSNDPLYLVFFWATLWSGAIAVPINAKLHAQELNVLVAQAQPKFIFYNGFTAQAVKQAVDLLDGNIPATINALSLTDFYSPKEIKTSEKIPLPVTRQDDDIAWLFFTSGTTGIPKGAQLTHVNLVSMAESLEEVIDIKPDDILLHAAPLSHGSGMYMIAAIMRGSTQMIPDSQTYNPEEIIDICRTKSQLWFFAAPTMVINLLEYAQENKQINILNKGLKLIIYGGGPMPSPRARWAEQLIPHRLGQIYGQGECPMTISKMSPQLHRMAALDTNSASIESVGTPFTKVKIKIDQPDENGIGEILVKSPLVMKGYADQPEATANTIQNQWLHTGDCGYIDENGFLYLRSRVKDVIISGGLNIYPCEVENILNRHESVREVAVLGKVSDKWGETVVAIIGLKDGYQLNEASLEQLCLDNIARFKRPTAYYVSNELPKNAYGKIDKVALRQQLETLYE